MTGFTGSSSAAIITMNSELLLTDFRYIEQANDEVNGWQIVRAKTSLLKTIASKLKRECYRKIAFESNSTSFEFFQQLSKELSTPSIPNQCRPYKCKLVPVKGWVEELRAVKTDSEREALRAAAKLVDDCFRYALRILKPGKTEQEIAIKLEYFIKKRKKADISFNIILLSGPRSSLPHGKPSSRILRKQDMVLLDIGALWHGYCSDLTRTISLGRMNYEQRKVYTIVLETQEKALRTLKPEIKASKLFSSARRMIHEAGYSLDHGLGHGLGLEVHEYPRVGAGSTDVMRKDMVLTIEPGIYLKRRFGIRIEDMVLVKEKGVEVLTHSPKQIIEL